MPAALPCKLPAVLTNLKTRHLTDQDLLEDLESLTKMMTEYTSEQTTFSEYSSEVNSGHLRWSPPHKNADFWRENARQIIEQDRGDLCRKLAEILSKDWLADVRRVLEVKQALEVRLLLAKSLILNDTDLTNS